MEERFFLLTVLLVTPALVFSQTAVPKATQDHGRPMHLKRNQSAVIGCLKKNPHNEYELVDENGNHNLLYSSTVPLDTYVGQSLTLIGERSATPNSDVGTARPMPYFKVVDLRLCGNQVVVTYIQPCLLLRGAFDFAALDRGVVQRRCQPQLMIPT